MTLYGKTLEELTELVADQGLPAYTAKQIAHWLYSSNATSIEQMTNLSKKAREQLAATYSVGITDPVQISQSTDGTKKYLFAAGDHHVETAFIPESDHATLCVSSQVGCKMGCDFCMTGKQGFQQNLTSTQILNQLRSVAEYNEISNVVYMGMGEPLNNLDEVLKSTEVLTSDWGYGWSPKRITVSTVGIIPELKRFLAQSRCHLAVSLHNPFHEERLAMMPVEKAFPIAEVVAEIRKHSWYGQRRVSFEYIMFDGINDTQRHLNRIAELLNGIECRVNLIRFHNIPNSPYKSSPDGVITNFRNKLTASGVFTTIRASRGQDIKAACGLLSTAEWQQAPSSTNLNVSH